MSDPSDPYRGIDIGGGINPFGETIAGLDVIESQLSKTEEVLISISNQFSGFTSSFEGLLDMTKDMGKNLDLLTKGMKEPRVEKTITKTEKMFKAIKKSGAVVAEVLNAFIGAGSAKDVFGNVVTGYSKYLSDVFWGDIVSAIDWASITTVISDILGPIFAGMGNIIATGLEYVFQSAPVGASIGGAVGGLIGMLKGPIGAMFGTMIGSLLGWGIEALINLYQVPPTTGPGLDEMREEAEALLAEGLSLEETYVALMKTWKYGMAFAEAGIYDVSSFIEYITGSKFTEPFPTPPDLPTGPGGEPVPNIGGWPGATGAGPQPESVPFWEYGLPEPEGEPFWGGLQEGGFALSRGIYELAEEETEVVIPLSKWEKSVSTQNALLSSMNDELVNLAFINRELLKNKKSKYIFERMKGRR